MSTTKSQQSPKTMAQRSSDKVDAKGGIAERTPVNPLWSRLATGMVQAKLTVSAPDSPYEREADQMAAQVMSMPAPGTGNVRHNGGSSGAKTDQAIQTKPLSSSVVLPEKKDKLAIKSEAGEKLASSLNQSKGRGAPLPDPVRSSMESRFGVDFEHVRIHTGNDAMRMNREVSAKAFTHGTDIYFGEGYSPTNSKLIAHELAHVVQQTGGTSLHRKKREATADAEQVPSISRLQIFRDATSEKSAGVALLEANRDKLETIRGEAFSRMGKLLQLESSSREAISAVKEKLIKTSRDYDEAYGKYAKVIQRAKAEAQNQELWTDIVVGIAIGVLVGVTIEAGPALFVAEAAAGAATAGLKAAGKSGTKTVAKEGGGEDAEAGIGQAAKKLGLKVQGTDLEPGGMRPEILKMGIWKSLTQLHETAPKIGDHMLTQGLLMSNAEYAIGEIKALSGGGKADMSEEDVIELVLDVIKFGEASKSVDKKLSTAELKIKALVVAARAESTYGVAEMERDIWMLWMASLDLDSNILDIDEIEDYLGPNGLKLVDFGFYTFDSEENKAIRDARAEKRRIDDRRKEAMAVGSASPTRAAEDAVPGSTSAPPTYGEKKEK